MDKPTQIRLAKELGELVTERRTTLAESVYCQPTEKYTDPERARLERDMLFRRYPLVLGAAGAIPEPGDFFTCDVGGVPLLVVRADDGSISALLNICRHRGNKVCQEESGRKSLFLCEYHSWSYDRSGRLKSFVDKSGFEGASKEDFGLIKMPIEIRHGMIWVIPDPDAQIDVEKFLGPDLDHDLAGYDIENYHYYKSVSFKKKFNWKLGVDTFMEVFHIEHLHRTTAAPLVMSNISIHENFSLHHRMILPRKGLPAMLATPENEWDVMANTSTVYGVFPNTTVNWVMDHIEIFSFLPDPADNGQCMCILTMLLPEAPNSEKAEEHWERTWNVLTRTIMVEDFDTMESTQANIESGMLKEMLFGRNEISLQEFHKKIDSELVGGTA